MAILVNIHQISMSFGSRTLFKEISFGVETSERIGLIGPNGAGKSTLLKILSGQTEAESGTLSFQKGLRVGFLEQVPALDPTLTVLETIIGTSQDWANAQTLISKLDLDGDVKIGTLSGGWKKRVALARELFKEPDLLLLDEPTNHLDVESILMLEEILKMSSFASITITHDRAFLQNVSSRILELDRRNPNGLLNVQGDYATYLEVKEGMIASQQVQEVRLRNTLRREVEWLRQGAKARTTKQQARITRAGHLGAEVEDLTQRNKDLKVRIDFQSSGRRNPKKLIEAKGISKTYGKNLVVPKIDLLLTPQTRLGILGANGAGKSTLIRMLLGEEESDTGTIIRSDQLQAVYFEQNRETLDPQLTVRQTVCPTGDSVYFRGQRVHVNGYLDRFLFTQEQFQMKVEKLSGGEQSRLLIARLMLHEANLLILDEPTNDLDVATLDILQDVLQEFDGGIVLVTHDRFFMDQCADQILAFSKSKELLTFEGLGQWTQWFRKNMKVAYSTPSSGSVRDSGPKKKKLSFKDQFELDNIEEAIRKTETRLEAIQTEAPGAGRTLQEITQEMANLHQEVERLYTRWSELESMSKV